MYLSICAKNQKRFSLLFGITEFVFAGFFILIALATYTANIANGTSYSYGYSYYLGWVSMVGAVAMAVISAVMARVSDYLVLA